MKASKHNKVIVLDFYLQSMPLPINCSNADKCIQSALWEDREPLFAVSAHFCAVNTPTMAYVLYKILGRDIHNRI